MTHCGNLWSHKSVSLYFCVMSVDGMWHGEFTQHQSPIDQETPNHGSGSDDGNSMTDHGSLPAPGLLPAVQRALFVRLTQKYQEGEEPSSTQTLRGQSKEEGILITVIASFLFWCQVLIQQYSLTWLDFSVLEPKMQLCS